MSLKDKEKRQIFFTHAHVFDTLLNQARVTGLTRPNYREIEERNQEQISGLQSRIVPAGESFGPAQLRKRRVWIVRTEAEARVLMDPMRREILRLLASSPRTGNELSKILGLSPPTICHHLQALKDLQFISVERTEPESHGIVQKFYKSNALAFIIDSSRLPIDMRRYFAPMELERVRGFMGALLTKDRGFDVSVDFLERLCERFSRAVVEVAETRGDTLEEEDPESYITHIYQEALIRLQIDSSPTSNQPAASTIGNLASIASRLPGRNLSRR